MRSPATRRRLQITLHVISAALSAIMVLLVAFALSLPEIPYAPH